MAHAHSHLNRRRGARLVGTVSLALALGSCQEMPFVPTRILEIQTEGVLVGAGDIANCETGGAAATAALLDQIPGTVFTAGDNAYFHGSADDYRRCYEPTWGRHKARTRPSPGNHEYESAGASPYFAYFGGSAGPADLGYYRFSVGPWTIVSLNSNVDAGPGSPQLTWLRRELEEQRPRCLAAIWHHPIVSSGLGVNPMMRDVWRLLQEFDAELVISGHDHQYERFVPLDGNGVPDPRGIRLFVVGTGGAEVYPGPFFPRFGSESRANGWGVLKLTLRSDSYDWAFIPVAPSTARDQGGDLCR